MRPRDAQRLANAIIINPQQAYHILREKYRYAMCVEAILCPNAARPRSAMADVIGGVPRKVTPVVKRAWGGEEDAQASTSVTAQSLVHVPFARSCHWGAWGAACLCTTDDITPISNPPR